MNKPHPLSLASRRWAALRPWVLAGLAALPGLAAAYCEDPAGLADGRSQPRAGAASVPADRPFEASELFDGPAQGDAKAQLGSLVRQVLADCGGA